MEKKILVTEANEIVATEVTNQLLALELPIRIAVRDESMLSEVRGQSVEAVVADYADPDSLTGLFRDVSGVFLGVPFLSTLADLSRNLSAAAQSQNVEHIVYHSVMGAENPTFTVAQWHRKAEQYIESSGIPFTLLRPNITMQDFITRQGEHIRGQGRIIAPLGEARVSFVDARDVAECAVECLTGRSCHGMGFTLTGPESLSPGQIAEILSEVLDRTIEYEDVDEDRVRREMAEHGAPGWLVDAHIDRYARYRVGGAGAEVTDAVRAVTGHNPRDFRKFSEDYAAMWLAGVGA